MKNVKVNFTIPEDVATSLKTLVARGQCSSFVATAIRDRLHRLEQQELRRGLIEGYKERCAEGRDIDGEWEAATLEQWPE